MEHKQLVNTARLTGVWYLILAIAGMLGFILFHSKVFVYSDPKKTLSNLTDPNSLASIRLMLELVIVLSQALAAVWFYKLFFAFDKWAAAAIGIWGTVNSVVILSSAIAMNSAIELANSTNQALEYKEALIQLLVGLMNNAWSIGGLFFGLWLIPMGHVIITSKRMPVWLGRILILGGVGYILQTFIKCFGVQNQYLDVLVIPATIGEFWMIGYLLIYGIRPETIDEKAQK